MRGLLLLIVLLISVPAQALVIEQATRWQGEMQFAETVVVPQDVTLTVASGSRIVFTSGGLEVSGALVAGQVEFTGENWQGITLKGTDGQTRLQGGSISGAKTGLLVQGGMPRIEAVAFKDNKVGLELRGKSAAHIEGCLFTANRKVGLFIKDESVATVLDCRFTQNGKFGAYIYRASPARFSGNRFINNPTGLMVAYFGSDPLIEGNHFEGNDTGIQVDRAARPELRGNRIERNRLGLYLYRRSDPLVTANRLTGNEVGILVAYSSYPRINGNDIEANGLALKLEFQSSQWELQLGAVARAGETAGRSSFGGQAARTVTEEDRRARDLDGTVDVRNNWWGEQETLALGKTGQKGNPAFIHDGRDQETFVDAEKTYPLDTVVFTPWSEQPLTGDLP
jgi:parallel beta-helix repeat protein